MFLVLIFTGFVLYLIHVHRVRYHRLAAIESLPDPLIGGFISAHQIFQQLSFYEFPLILVKSLEFGLFRTYGIPTISKLLVSTKQLTEETGKRYDDTDLLLREIFEHSLDEINGHTRFLAAITRLNEIHAHYSISNEDYLYTLSVFVCEPIRWIERFEWRSLCEKERNGIYVFWREIGIHMGIKDIPVSCQALFAFNEEYEKKYMKSASSNHRLGEATINLFLSIVPRIPGFHACGRLIIRALMDQRLCTAMGYEMAPHWIYQSLVVLFRVRAFIIRHCCLPRSKPGNQRIPANPKVGTTDVYIPKFTVYEDTYPNGYTIETLGPHQLQKGKIFKCPMAQSSLIGRTGCQ